MHRSKEGYYVNRHSYFLLRYHLVLVTRYRKPVIKDHIEEDLKMYITTYFNDRGYPVEAMECMPDHVHILFEADPQLEMAKFINALKSASSRYIRTKYHNELSRYFWKPYFWSLSYFVCTVSDRSAEVVKKYIDTQKEK